MFGLRRKSQKFLEPLSVSSSWPVSDGVTDAEIDADASAANPDDVAITYNVPSLQEALDADLKLTYRFTAKAEESSEEDSEEEKNNEDQSTELDIDKEVNKALERTVLKYREQKLRDELSTGVEQLSADQTDLDSDFSTFRTLLSELHDQFEKTKAVKLKSSDGAGVVGAVSEPF